MRVCFRSLCLPAETFIRGVGPTVCLIFIVFEKVAAMCLLSSQHLGARGCEVPSSMAPVPFSPRHRQDNEGDHLQLSAHSGSWPDDSRGLVEETQLPGGGGRWWLAGWPPPLCPDISPLDLPSATTSPPPSPPRHPRGDGDRLVGS